MSQSLVVITHLVLQPRRMLAAGGHRVAGGCLGEIRDRAKIISLSFLVHMRERGGGQDDKKYDNYVSSIKITVCCTLYNLQYWS